MTHVADQGPPRAVLGSESPDDRDVGPAETRPRLAQRLAQERQTSGRAVSHGRLRDRDDYREESIFLVEEAAHIRQPSSAERNFDGAGVVSSGGFSIVICARVGDAQSVSAIRIEIA
jgi:hypothetical protein